MLVIFGPDNKFQMDYYLCNMRKLIFYILVFACSTSALAQAQFDQTLNIPVTENGQPLRFSWVGGINFPKMSSVDLNNDGLSDIFMFDGFNNRILTFLNNGNTSSQLAWDYALQYINKFPPVKSWAFLYDYNCDGKADFFTASSKIQCSGIAVYKNNYTTGTGFNWTVADSCLQETYVTLQQNIFTNSIAIPNFNDIDGDGDMDILGYSTVPNGRIIYHKNLSKELYGNCDSLKFALESLCWGNFQLKIGGANEVGCFQCPCRMGRPMPINSTRRQFMEDDFIEPDGDQSKAAPRDDTVSSIFAIDIDGNGFKDLLVGDIAAQNTLMVHNNGTEMDSQDTLFPSYNYSSYFSGFHYHAYLDADNDGKNDLIIMPSDYRNKYGLWLYKNTGTNASPIFNFESNSFLQKDMIDAGEIACPAFLDYDCDSLLDLVINKSVYDSLAGTYETGLYLYKNIGTPSNPAFDLISTDFAGLTGPHLYSNYIFPTFGDLDGDGDQDMMLGVQDGHLHYYENTAGAGNPATFVGPQVNYMAIDVGNFSTPQIFDLNKDGLLDLIIGGQRGFLYYYKNTGSITTPQFGSLPDNDSLGCIVLQGQGTTDGYTVPFFYDSLGATRLLVSNEKGNIYQYDNIDGNLFGCFHLAGTVYDTVESSRVKFNISVNGGDLNHDGYTDIIIGQATGGAEIRYQHTPFSGISNDIFIRPTFEVFPNPVNDNMEIRFYNTGNNSTLLKVYNSIGEKVFEKSVREEKATIKTSSWASGMYFVQLISGKSALSRKVVLRH